MCLAACTGGQGTVPHVQNKRQTALMPIADWVGRVFHDRAGMGGGIAVLQGGGVESARRRSAPACHAERTGVVLAPNGDWRLDGFILHGNSRRYLPPDGSPEGCTDGRG